MSKYCPKWWCGGVVERTPVRTCCMKSVTVTVVAVRCAKCGWQHEDYRVKRRQAVSK